MAKKISEKVTQNDAKSKNCEESRVDKDQAKIEKLAENGKLTVSPEFAAIQVILGGENGTVLSTQIDVASMVDELRKQALAVNRGDFSHVETMLMIQAESLQSLFASLTRRALMQSNIQHIESFMRIALRAQNQCRTTLETLSAIKNPPVIFAKQANINQGDGNQQVNNCTPAPNPHAEKNVNQQNELLEVNHGGKKLDTRAARKPSRKNKAMATVE